MKQIFLLLLITSCLILFSCGKDETPSPATPPPTLTTVTTAAGVTGGPKNTIITINGTNFTTDLSKITVTVNGKPCVVLTANATAITAQIPANCGTGNVVVTINGVTINGPVFNYVYTYTLSSVTNGQVGYVDGPLATAKWDEQAGLCVDTAGNIFINQYSKPIVRKITSDLTMASTIAGDRTVGDVNDNGSSAKLGNADNISIDNNGTIFYADQTAHKIKKIDAAKNVTTFITCPTGFAPVTVQVVNASGNVYVCGDFNGYAAIYKYNTSGVLQWRVISHGIGSTDGDSSVVKLNYISFGNIAIDAAEQTLYFASNSYTSLQPSEIKKLNLSTLVTTTIAGSQTVSGTNDGPAATSTFKLVTGLALDNLGGLYIADGFNHKIRYLFNGTVSTVVGLAGNGDVDGDAATAKLSYPDGIAFNKGSLFIACVSNNKVKRLIRD
jgi:IPT/TIG domain